MRSCEIIVTEKYTPVSQWLGILVSIDSPVAPRSLGSPFRDLLPDRLLRKYAEGGEGGGDAAAAADNDGKGYY